MKNRYAGILEEDTELNRAAAKELMQSKDIFEEIAAGVFAPAAVMYASMIISEAEKKGIRRLYFLSRDGYLPYAAAKVICKRKNSEIKCSYFYCSRYSLRMAAYRFFDDSAYDKLFIYAYKLSARIMLKRAGFDEKDREAIYADIGFDKEKENEIMDRAGFDSFCSSVKSSEIFRDMIKTRSDIAYDNIVSYIKQEEMDRYDRIGIVDLGWTGSLQYTLRRILDSMEIKTDITGFYIGMLEAPKTSHGSRFSTWLFDEKQKSKKAWFAHNLLECAFSAPHGMTEGYEIRNGRTEPVLCEDENDSKYVKKIEDIAQRLAKVCCKEYRECYKDMTLKLFKKLMFSPLREEAEALSDYSFCDDVNEQYHSSIIKKDAKAELRKEILPFKLFCKGNTDGLYWYCGSASFCGALSKRFYRYDYFLTKLMISLLR